MVNTPSLTNPGIPEILQYAVDHKSSKKQEPENGQYQQFMIGMELVRIKRLQYNDHKGQKNA